MNGRQGGKTLQIAQQMKPMLEKGETVTVMGQDDFAAAQLQKVLESEYGMKLEVIGLKNDRLERIGWGFKLIEG